MTMMKRDEAWHMTHTVHKPTVSVIDFNQLRKPILTD